MSATGIYVDTVVPVGSPGDLAELEILSLDRERGVQVSCRVTRVIRQDDLEQGAAVIGAAFEFLLSDTKQGEVMRLLDHVTSHQLKSSGAVPLDRPLSAWLESRQTGTIGATVKTLGTELMLLKLGTPVGAGQFVQIDIPYGHEEVAHFQGRVVRCTPQYAVGDATQFALLIELETPQALPVGRHSNEESTELVEGILRSLVTPSLPPTRAEDCELLGQLSQIRLASLLSMIADDEMSGRLTVANLDDCIVLEIATGKVVSAASMNAPLVPEQAIKLLSTWGDGEFRFRVSDAS